MNVSFPSLSLQARSLDIPTSIHPNKLPFSGVLTRIDEPSDAAPEGSNGKRILLTRAAAEQAVDSLLGMAINYNPSGHSPQEKIGFISSAEIHGNEIRIGGFIYAADFPDITATIRANRDKLGFSFEARDLMTTDPDADPIPIVECVFTGAAILLKDKAAYRTTFIHANNSNKDFSEMNIFEKMTAAERNKVADQIVAASEHMTVEERRTLIASLTDSLAGIQAKGGDEKQRTVLSKISAARSNTSGAYDMKGVDGALRRANLPPIEVLAVKPEYEIASILASANKKFKDFERISVRHMLYKLGALPR